MLNLENLDLPTLIKNLENKIIFYNSHSYQNIQFEVNSFTKSNLKYRNNLKLLLNRQEDDIINKQFLEKQI